MAFSPRDHVKAVVGVLLGVATVLGAIAVLVPGIRGTMARTGVLGWIAALVFFAFWLAALIVADAGRGSSDALVRSLKVQLAQASEERRREVQDTQAGHERDRKQLIEIQAKERADLTSTKDAQISDLRSRMTPTARDVEQFNQLLALLPPDRGAMGWLESRFNAKQWTAEDFEALAEVQGNWRHRFFDDAEVHQAWVRLRETISVLTSWMAVNASPDRELNKYQPSGAPTIYSVADGDERAGGWPAFDALRNEGMKLADDVMDARHSLERVGRHRGL